MGVEWARGERIQTFNFFFPLTSRETLFFVVKKFRNRKRENDLNNFWEILKFIALNIVIV